MRRIRVEEGNGKDSDGKMATMISSTEVHGGRLLREIAAEEGSLEDVSIHSLSLALSTLP